MIVTSGDDDSLLECYFDLFLRNHKEESDILNAIQSSDLWVTMDGETTV